MQLKHVIVINILFSADLVHCLAFVQASHVICLHFCVADSVTPFPPCVFYFQSDIVCIFFPRAKYFNRQNSLLGSGGGGGVGVYCSLSVGGRMELFKIKGECHEGEG